MAQQTSSPIHEAWLSGLKPSASRDNQDDPSYHTSDPEQLVTKSDPVSFTLGTGTQVLSSILSSCETTVLELIIVTCFWAKSSSRDAIRDLLFKLSHRALNRAGFNGRKIRVRICISSLSITQKLFHTTSLNGHVYPPNSWTDLGLPPPAKLKGLDLVVKSIFIRPFSVMHPKFILMDRERAWFPSCNVSWEEWFEGSVELRGPIIETLFDFWSAFWGRKGGGMELPRTVAAAGEDAVGELSLGSPAVATRMKSDLISGVDLPPSSTTTILLPSPHHRNPLTSQVPPTPLNTFLLAILSNATGSIRMQTPNLTSGPVLKALLAALARGVDVKIVTSRLLMILEQLATACTITEIEIWKLRRRYRRLLALPSDPEAGNAKPGDLKIGYFRPKKGVGEPVKTHLKLTIVDGNITVLGSGNMDRASWFTSQELGVALVSAEVAGNVASCVDYGLEERVEWLEG